MATVAKLFKGKLIFTTIASGGDGGASITNDWSCQATQVVLEQDAGDTEDPVVTLCGDEVGGASTPGAYHLSGTILQDWTDATNSVQRFSWQNNGRDVRVSFVPDDRKVVNEVSGVVTMGFLGLGGETNARLTRDFDFIFGGRPVIDPWDPPPPTGVTPGTPGTWVPANATVPASMAVLRAAGDLGQTTAWATGNYIVLGDTSEAYWDGTAWQTGRAPVRVVPITGVTAGTPGAFQPGNATKPMGLSDLAGDPVVGDAGTNKPSAAWTAGQSVKLGDTTDAHWDGDSWATGVVS